MLWAILAVVAILGLYLIGFALCRSAARNDRIDRAYFRNRAEPEAMRLHATITEDQQRAWDAYDNARNAHWVKELAEGRSVPDGYLNRQKG